MHVPNQSVPKKWPFRLAVAWLSIVGLSLLAFIVWAVLQTPTAELFSFLKALGTLFVGGALFTATVVSISFVVDKAAD